MSYLGISCWTRDRETEREGERQQERDRERRRDTARERERQKLRYTLCVRLDELLWYILLDKRDRQTKRKQER